MKLNLDRIATGAISRTVKSEPMPDWIAAYEQAQKPEFAEIAATYEEARKGCEPVPPECVLGYWRDTP